MNTDSATFPGLSDEELWRRSIEGDRDAFSRIVQRYQVLICSLALSACGSVANSEDIAQETFVAAWRRLRELREPGKLRPWLCGIARNLAANAARRNIRRGEPAVPLEVTEEAASLENDPAAEAVSHEEEALMWRTLSALPETYREPMVLFYREQQSVAQVAEALGLSEEAVRQRLARGRSLLREEISSLVESTLIRTRPGTTFTLGVLAALPMASASAATGLMNAAAQGTASVAAKGIMAKLGLGALIGPVIGLAFAYLGTKAAASTARSEPEKRFIIHSSRWIIAFCFIMSIGLAMVLSQAGKLYVASASWIVTGITLWTLTLVGGIMAACRRMDRHVRQIRTETGTTDEALGRILGKQGGREPSLPKYFETTARFLGLPLFAMAWGGMNSDRYRARRVTAWLAIGDIAVSPLLAFGGIAVAPIAMGAISIGVLSLSLFWGIAVGVLAVGSLAFGWWALGCVAAGVKCAVGFAAVARDYALGMVASGAHSGSAAREWLVGDWWTDFTGMMLGHLHWWVLLCLVIAAVLRPFQAAKRSQIA